MNVNAAQSALVNAASSATTGSVQGVASISMLKQSMQAQQQAAAQLIAALPQAAATPAATTPGAATGGLGQHVDTYA